MSPIKPAAFAPLGLWILLSAAACATPPGGGHSPAPHEAAADLQLFLDSAVHRGLPGVSAAVATSSGVIWTGAAGKADLRLGTPVHPDMLFGIGSITKVFVAAVVLQLAEEGEIDLSSTVETILGASVAGVPNAATATIAQLLNHTSGIPSWEDDMTWIREGRGDRLEVSRVWDKTATLEYIRGDPPLAQAGERFSYSNSNFTLLGMVIERVTGADAAAEIRRRILTPLKLDAYLEGFEPGSANSLPRRYHWATPDFLETAGVNPAFRMARPGLIDVTDSNLSVEWTAGGMLATARDLVLFAVALRDGRLLSPESMELMRDWLPVGDEFEVGRGLFRFEWPDGLAVIGHNGDVLGFSASLHWVEGTDAVVAVISNVGSMHAGEVPIAAYSLGTSRRLTDLALAAAGAELRH